MTANNIYIRIFVCLFILTVCSCTRTVYVPVERVKHVTTTEVDTFVEVVTPPERVVNVTTDTTSVISTRYATSTAEVSNGILSHEIMQHERKDSVKTQTVYIQEVDSIPYTIEVERITNIIPQWCWISLIINATIITAIIVIGVNKIKGIKCFL